MVSYVLRFDRLCRDRREAGIKQYRGGDPHAPFVGDVVREIDEEGSDLTIYIEEAAKQGHITEEVAIEAQVHVLRALTTIWDGLGRR
jgi:hypothetical protein